MKRFLSVASKNSVLVFTSIIPTYLRSLFLFVCLVNAIHLLSSDPMNNSLPIHTTQKAKSFRLPFRSLCLRTRGVYMFIMTRASRQSSMYACVCLLPSFLSLSPCRPLNAYVHQRSLCSIGEKRTRTTLHHVQIDGERTERRRLKSSASAQFDDRRMID